MRTRTNTTSQTVPQGTAKGYTLSGSLLWTVTNGPIVCDGEQRISDVNDSPEKENPVNHFTWKVDPILLETEIVSSSPNLVVKTDENYRFNEAYQLFGINLTETDWTTSDNANLLRSYRSQAWSRIKPTFSRGPLNLTVFFLELKELRTMFQGWSRRDPLIKDAAKINLAYRFGISPFLMDLNAAAEALSSFHRRWATFLEQMGKPQVRHVALPMSPLFLDSEDWEEVNSYYAYKRRMLQQQSIYRLTVVYRYTCPIPEPMARVAALIDNLGGILNPATLWERIPFSFVVDWFFDVGSYLDKLRIDQLPVDISVLSCTESVKIQATCQSLVRIESYEGPVFTETMKQYSRAPVSANALLNNTVIQSGSGLNAIRYGLIASLIVAKVPRPKKYWSSSTFTERVLTSQYAGLSRRDARKALSAVKKQRILVASSK